MRRLLAWYTNASLRSKFALHAALTTTFTFAILLPFVLYTQRQVVLAEVEDAGLRMAEIFARSSVQAVAADDYLMMQFVVNGVAGGARVVSAMLIQDGGTVLVHSKASERGKRYTDERSLAAARTEAPLIQRYQLAAGPFVYDFALPVYVLTDKQASARVVVSIERELAAIARTRNAMILLGLAILGFGFAWATYQAERVTRPIRALVRGTVEITRHNLDNRIPVTSRDELGQLAGAFNTMTDDLKAARTDLIEKTRLAAMGEVAAVVAHETRNPLGALSNCVQLLGKRPQTLGDDAEILEIMQSEVERLNGIVSDFLAFGRPRRPRLQEFELHELLDGALAALGRDRRCSASIALVRTFDPGLGCCRRIRISFARSSGTCF